MIASRCVRQPDGDEYHNTSDGLRAVGKLYSDSCRRKSIAHSRSTYNIVQYSSCLRRCTYMYFIYRPSVVGSTYFNPRTPGLFRRVIVEGHFPKHDFPRFLFAVCPLQRALCEEHRPHSRALTASSRLQADRLSAYTLPDAGLFSAWSTRILIRDLSCRGTCNIRSNSYRDKKTHTVILRSILLPDLCRRTDMMTTNNSTHTFIFGIPTSVEL